MKVKEIITEDNLLSNDFILEYNLNYSSDRVNYLEYKPLEIWRIKTNLLNGIILYSHGSMGDYFALQLRDNQVIFNIDLGFGFVTTLSLGRFLDNSTWHDVIIIHNFNNIVLYIDRVSVHKNILEDFIVLNLSAMRTSDISITFLSDLSYVKLHGYNGKNFFSVSFSFRTFEYSGLLMYHKFSNNGYVKIYLQNANSDSANN
ncbi:hypothetical protein PGB90_007814 [Kerria lacca]